MLNLLKFDITAGQRFAGTFRQLKGELGNVRGVLAGVDDYARRTGRSLRNIGAGLSAGVTAPVALLGRQSVMLYDQQVKAEQAVAQAITSTGAAAGRTLQELKGLASGLQQVSTFGDEDILQNVTAPLLTFTKVQGEVFDRAQTNILDMATLLQMDLKSAAIQVGKALNDPVKGVSALSEAGVQFSEEQKQVIKSLVETGDVAKAQTLILQELETQFKGQAAAAANTPLGQWDQLRNAVGNLKEELGEQIVPFLVPLIEKIESTVNWFGQLSPEVKKTSVVIAGLAAAIGPVAGTLGVVTLGISSLIGPLSSLGALLVANPIGASIAAIAAGATLIIRNWEPISGFFAGLWGGLSEAFTAGWSAIKTMLSETYSPQVLIYGLWAAVPQWFAALAPELTQAFVTLWDAIKAEVSTWPGKMLQAGKDAVAGFVSGLLSGFGDVEKAGGSIARTATRATKKALDSNSPSKVFMQIGRDVVEGFAIGISNGENRLVGALQSITENLKGVGKEAKSQLGSALPTLLNAAQGGVKSLLNSVQSLAQQFISMRLNKALVGLAGSLFPSLNLTANAKGNAFSNGRVQAFARGTVVSGPTMFPMANGTGLMGEAGPEAIMPLSRGSDGKLGVVAQNTNGAPSNVNVSINIINQVPGVGVRQTRNDSGRIDVEIYQMMDSYITEGHADHALDHRFGIRAQPQGF